MTLHLKITSSFNEIQKTIPRCIELARRLKADLPFHYMYLPLQWWIHFNNLDDSIFSQKRGKNFLGLQSSLNEFYLLTVEDNGVLIGAAPLVSYSLKLPGKESDYRMLAFAGDYITATCQDFLVDLEKQGNLIEYILQRIIVNLGPNHDLLFFGYIPENSINIPYIQQHLSSSKNINYSYLEKTTARRGGVWPWTVEPIMCACNSILKKTNITYSYYKKIKTLSDKMNETTPLSLLFPKTRKTILKDLHTILLELTNNKELKQDVEAIKYCLNPANITYPYIKLPHDREAYWQSLSKSKRYYFKRYLKRFLESGGGFEKITGKAVTEKDIEDCIRLHLMRWGRDSTAVCGDSDAFHLDVGMEMAKENMFSIFFSTLNGERIAAHSCFDIGQRREFYLPGRNPKYDKLRAGSLLVMETILDAIDSRFKTYDLGVVGFQYKMDFTNTVYTTRNFFIYQNNNQPDLNIIFKEFECMN